MISHHVLVILTLLWLCSMIFGKYWLLDFMSTILLSYKKFIAFHQTCRCTYCAKLAVEFDKVSELLRGTIEPFALAKIDCGGSGKETCLKYSIVMEEYPILTIFRRGTLGRDYDGPEDAGKCE